MKRLVSFMVAGMMTVLLTACGQQAPKQPDVKAAEPVQQQPAADKASEEKASEDKAAEDKAAESQPAAQQ